MKRLFKWIGTLLVSVILLAIGFLASFQYLPANQRLVYQACYIEGYETVFCQKLENDEAYLYRVIGSKDGEVVQVEHKIPKVKVGVRKL